ncbi:MAG: CpaF family protein [Rickettsiales bacterium]
MFGKKIADGTDLLPTTALPAAAPSPLQNPSGLPPAQRMATASITSAVASTGRPSDQHGAPLVRYRDLNLETVAYSTAKQELINELLDQVDFQTLELFSIEKKRQRVAEACNKIVPKISIPLTAAQINLLTAQAIDEILGFGPIEPLLRDADVNDIMINTAKKVYVENKGKMLVTDIEFLSEAHLIGIIQRIVSRVGRRVDEANPMVDARMPDGSRFNAIIPPLALDGALVSIRKFKKNKMPLSDYMKYDSMSPAMAQFLSIASAIRLNIVISGGTGSGKTTLLNALSGHIDPTERIITIEDAAELLMHQPHVLRLETRPASTEGRGEINQRQLVKNALRMRPDRIILGEIRGDEVIDVLSAMNTGHDGSMATIHANTPRDCLARIENLVAMSGVKVEASSLRYQISSAVNLIVQIQRMRDGSRRITHIEEVLGYTGGEISTQTLFSYQPRSMGTDGKLIGEFVPHNVRPALLSRAEYYGRDKEVLACLGVPAVN